MKIPSMGLLPWLWVAGGHGCCDVGPSTRPTNRNVFLIVGNCTSSFMSAITMMMSPSACHCIIVVASLVKNIAFGELVLFLEARCHTCCWYVERGPHPRSSMVKMQRLFSGHGLNALIGKPSSTAPAPHCLHLA